MLLVGFGALAAASAAVVLPILLYYHFVDCKKSNAATAFTFCCTLTLALLLAFLVPIDIMLASSMGSGSLRAQADSDGAPAPSVAEAAAAAHASNTASAFTPAGAAAAAAAAEGWRALKNAFLPLTVELLQRMYAFLGFAVFICCFLLTPAAIFYSNESNRRRAQDVDEYDALPCETCFVALKRTGCYVVGLGAILLILLALRPGMPSPTFFKTVESYATPTQQNAPNVPQNPHASSNPAGLMAAAAAAASAAAAAASAAAVKAAAAARQVDSEAIQLYTAQLLGVHKTGVDSLLFLGACFLCAAQVVWIFFGAFGLAAVPLAWLRRGPSTHQKQQQVQQEITALREQQRRIQSKYAGNLHAMGAKDREVLERLRIQQRLCSEKHYQLQVLLLLSALLANHILAAALCIFTAAPQYASFGNQMFTPHNGSDAISCSLHAAAAGTSCRLTIFAAALSRVAFAWTAQTVLSKAHALNKAANTIEAEESLGKKEPLLIALNPSSRFSRVHPRGSTHGEPRGNQDRNNCAL
ncbi:uncharacterized protein LOC34618998 [Cyclospora cayetanensis]|uniref:Uncharacterized protein LOC34618998 n=1 Tax=Cyclospora cayetanensis TaxID=88456 RepID=A0A6P6RQU9_9EIME|nr:uncharacterized protein LOC34618998 [Cyclospora cayetanensis]